MAEFRLTTLWCIEAPLQPVWDAIHDSIMREGGLALARLLEARLVDSSE